jgi:hypothetical protein
MFKVDKCFFKTCNVYFFGLLLYACTQWGYLTSLIEYNECVQTLCTPPKTKFNFISKKFKRKQSFFVCLHWFVPCTRSLTISINQLYQNQCWSGIYVCDIISTMASTLVTRILIVGMNWCNTRSLIDDRSLLLNVWRFFPCDLRHLHHVYLRYKLCNMMCKNPWQYSF